MNKFKQWSKSNLFGLINLALGDHDPNYNHYEDFAEAIWNESAKQKQQQIESMLQDRYAELSELLRTDNSDICCEHYETGQREIMRLIKIINKGE